MCVPKLGTSLVQSLQSLLHSNTRVSKLVALFRASYANFEPILLFATHCSTPPSIVSRYHDAFLGFGETSSLALVNIPFSGLQVLVSSLVQVCKDRESICYIRVQCTTQPQRILNRCLLNE